MSQRANFVIVEGGSASAYCNSWGAMDCLYHFGGGPLGASHNAKSSDPVDFLWDRTYAEGGYLLDFDVRKAMVFGYAIQFEPDCNYLKVGTCEEINRALAVSELDYLKLIALQWQGWLLQWDTREIDAFAIYLKTREIHSIAAPEATTCSKFEVIEIQA